MKITSLNENLEPISTFDLNIDKSADFNHLHIDAELLKKAGKKITLRFSIPIIDMHGFWTQCPISYRPIAKLLWTYDIQSAQQKFIPYLAFYKLNMDNAATVALTCVHDEVRILARMDQMRCSYAFEVTVAIVDETEPFDLLLSFASKRWDLLLEDWRNILFPNGKPTFSDDAFEPVYCSWYAVHAAITNEYLDSNAKLAAELGFRTFILDDGWSYDEMKRVCPENMGKGWYRDIGNWTVSEKKLPNFKKHVEYAQSLGLKYLLWTSPFFAGICSAEFKKAMEDKDNEIAEHVWREVAFLAPNSKTAQHAIDLLKNLVTDLELDGLKIDFLDYIPLSVDKPYSRQCYAYFQKLSKTIRDVCPNALLEFRQSYGSPQMLEFGTQFRAGDAPFDFIENLHRIAALRLELGDRVPCHADPVYFHPEETCENVAHHMFAALAGVPMISMELSTLSPAHREIMAAWINFYKEHFETFKDGHWTVIHHLDALSYLTVENDDEIIAILLNPYATEKIINQRGKRTLFLLNLCGVELPACGADAFDCRKQPVAGDVIPVAGMLKITQE